MRPLFIAAAAWLAAAPVWAQPAPTGPPPPSPPRVFQQAGYAEPEIGAAACKAVNAGETQCAIPAMTAGVYLVQAAGASVFALSGSNAIGHRGADHGRDDQPHTGE